LADRFETYKDQPSNPKELKVVRTMTVTTTAYSSTVDQCDSTPCTAADGFNVCEHGKEDVVAANFLKFGTKIRVPALYGDKIFTVHDRMAVRFSNRVDFLEAFQRVGHPVRYQKREKLKF